MTYKQKYHALLRFVTDEKKIQDDRCDIQYFAIYPSKIAEILVMFELSSEQQGE